MNTTTLEPAVLESLREEPAPLYYRYDREVNAQPAYVEMDEDGEISTSICYEVGEPKAMPMDVWSNRTLRWRVPSAVRGSCLAAILESGEVRALFERVHAGHSVEWDGSNHRGHLSADAQAADEQLDQLFEETELDLVEIWSTEDFLTAQGTQSSLADWRRESETLEQYAERSAAAAAAEGLVLDGPDIIDILRQAVDAESPDE